MTTSWGANYPTITLEAGLNTAVTGFSTWDSGLWDTAKWGPDFAWVDITQYARGISTQRGRRREQDRFVAGIMDVLLDNRDARFTPANLSGPYVVGGVTKIVPQVPIRLSATWAGVTYYLFYGIVDEWVDDFPEMGYDAVTRVTAVDPLYLFTAYNGVAQASQGGGDTTGRRVNRWADQVRYPLPRSIQTGTVTVQPTQLAENAWEGVALAVDSEGGALWAEGDGTLTFEHQYALLENTRSNTSQVTFGPAAGNVKFRDPRTTSGSDLLRNTVAYARAGGTAQVATDATSVALYRDRPWSRSDLICETDAQCLGLAQLALAKWKDPEYRVTELTVDGVADPTNHWPHVLGRRIRDRATVTLNVSASGSTITKNVFIEGIDHTITRDMRWETRFSFGSATPYDGFTTSRWDTGVWDTATWFY